MKKDMTPTNWTLQQMKDLLIKKVADLGWADTIILFKTFGEESVCQETVRTNPGVYYGVDTTDLRKEGTQIIAFTYLEALEKWAAINDSGVIGHKTYVDNMAMDGKDKKGVEPSGNG